MPKMMTLVGCRVARVVMFMAMMCKGVLSVMVYETMCKVGPKMMKKVGCKVMKVMVLVAMMMMCRMGCKKMIIVMAAEMVMEHKVTGMFVVMVVMMMYEM